MKKIKPASEETSSPNRFPLGRFALILFLAVGAIKLFQFLGNKKLEASVPKADEQAVHKPFIRAAEAPRPGALGCPKLMTLTLEFDGVKAKTGYVGFQGINKDWNPGIDKNINGKTLSIHGKAYSQGIGVHAPSYIIFTLGGEVKRFSCLVGADSGGGGVNSVQFVVRGDGGKIFESKPMTTNDDALPLDLNVAGVRELSLIVNPVDKNDWDWADWVDLKFSKD
jgi:hypothetical protein